MEVNSINNTMPTPSLNTSSPSQSAGTSSIAKTSSSVETKPIQRSDNTKSQTVTPQAQAVASEYTKFSTDNANNNIRQHVQDIRSEEVEKQMREIVDKINSKLTTNTEVSLTFHARSNRLNIKIIDKQTKEIVKEWPSEKSLDFLAKLIDKEAVVLDKRL